MPSLKFSFPELLYLFGTFHGILLALFIARVKRSYQANIYLAALIALFSFYLLENSLFSSGYITHFPHLIYASIPVLYVLGPLFYLYTRSLVTLDAALKPADVLHVLPLLVEVAILWKFYSLPADLKIRVFESIQTAAYTFQFNIYFAGYLLYIGSALVYIFLSFRMLKRLKSTNDFQQTRIRWAKQSSRFFFGYMLISLVLSFLPLVLPGTQKISYHANLILQTLLIQCFGYVALARPEVIRQLAGGKKYQLSSLDTAALTIYKERLLTLMAEKELFLDPELSPAVIARLTGIPKHHLSQVMTEALNTNFYDFINGFRVERARRLMHDERYRGEKILAIAFDSGFSNKSTFIRSFKKITGKTPTEYRETVKTGSRQLSATA